MAYWSGMNERRIDPRSGLELGSDGNVILNPVIGWTTSTAANIGIVLAMKYISNPEEFETGGKSVQFVLTPQQSLELAEKLTELSNKVLSTDSRKPKQ
jgi:hypothetical protein